MKYRFIIILVITFILYFLLNQKEHFSNFVDIQCPESIKKLTNFCTWNKDKNKCMCVFQKSGDYYYNFPVCCDKDCSKLSKEECEPESDVKYYCQNNEGTDCESYNAYIVDNKVSGNLCGMEVLTNNYKRPYLSYDECKKELNECTKYKDQDKCIKNDKCGWCSNNSGKGLCIEGTAEGPIDNFKYYYCDPNQKNNNNSWTYGKFSLL